MPMGPSSATFGLSFAALLRAFAMTDPQPEQLAIDVLSMLAGDLQMSFPGVGSPGCRRVAPTSRRPVG